MNKRAIINPRNKDQLCFKWAILAKHVVGDNKFRVNKNKIIQNILLNIEDNTFSTVFRHRI